jgi:hypothetical protein
MGQALRNCLDGLDEGGNASLETGWRGMMPTERRCGSCSLAISRRAHGPAEALQRRLCHPVDRGAYVEQAP